ncbi:MAG: peptidyl-prolyl cis-trans isomerase [Dysgonamonadaceae bacterium]|jgi:hypothetical protein|nr:peptidyl-prolyl cis-trans isomerase [Dysgonamonadaceae bacterium]
MKDERRKSQSTRNRKQKAARKALSAFSVLFSFQQRAALIPVFILSFIILLTESACNKQHSNNLFEDVTIVKIGNNTLKRSELDSIIPPNSNPKDSLISTESYIKKWIKSALMYDLAKININNKKEIDQLVENYRQSLITHQYQEQLIQEKMSGEISEQEIQTYYAENKDKFRLETTLIKGLFIKVPIDAPQINKIKEWYKSTSINDLENIEKYSIQNAVNYDYFYDRWVSINEISLFFPVDGKDLEMRLRQQKQIEIADEIYAYFLNVKEVLFAGDYAPYEHSIPHIKVMLMNQKKIDFLRNMEEDLYRIAEKKGLIERYY